MMDGIRKLVADVLWAVLYMVMWVLCLVGIAITDDDVPLSILSICLMVLFGRQIHCIRKG